jgi:hypothetical protein
VNVLKVTPEWLGGITGVCIRLFTPHMQFVFECLGIGSSHYWRCSNWITRMERQLGDSQAMTHNSKFGQLLTHHKILGPLHTRRTADCRWGNIPISRPYILSCWYQRKAPQIWDKNVWTLWGKKQLRIPRRSMYCGTSYKLRTQHSVQFCWQVVWYKGRATVCTWIDGSPFQRSSTIHGVSKQRL